MVRVEGLEPACLSTLDPKSSASTNFATPATVNNYTPTILLVQDIFFIHLLADLTS